MLTIQQIAHREYLKSATWQDIRKQVLDRDNNKCKCGNIGYEVHHKTYKNWGNEKLKDLITLCRNCHETIHAAKRGTKKSRAIGTRAIIGYLNEKQKKLIYDKFPFIRNDSQLKFFIHREPLNEICNFAANLLGYTNWYPQGPTWKMRKPKKHLISNYIVPVKFPKNEFNSKIYPEPIKDSNILSINFTN